jgi:hypothetical protein
MHKPANLLIHNFIPSSDPIIVDEEGDEMLGFYYQFADENGKPISNLVGPYQHDKAAEEAALKALELNDF